MRQDVIRISSTVTVGIGILMVFLVFLARCIALSNWSHLSGLEIVILSTLVIRVVLVLGLGKQLHLQPLFAMILFSIEVFLIPFLALLAIWTADPEYTVVMGAVLTTWIGVSAVVLSPYSIYELAKSMLSEVTHVSILVMGMLEIGGMLFLSSVLSATDSMIQGPSSLGTLLIQLGKSQISPAGFQPVGSNFFLVFGIALFYLGMMSHLSLAVKGANTPIRFSEALLFILAASVLVLVWMSALHLITSNLVFVFTVPTVVGVAGIWWSTHVK